jgi:hypothetical protein
MQRDTKSKLAWPAGMVAVLLFSAIALASASTQAYAAMDDKMTGDKMNDSSMMEEAHMLKGSISNVQLDSSGQPEWIQSGYWVLWASSESANFVAKITMVKPDGTSLHTHTISQLSVPENSMMMEGTTDTIKGTATVLMPSGAVQGVPITIKVMNNAVVALWIGPDKVDGHFGTSPIYGTVFQSKAAMEGGHMMQDMTQKLDKTNLPITLPLTQGYVGGNKVFYISTEASDKDLAAHLTNVTGTRVAFAPSLAKTPAGALANIYAFTNGIEGPGPIGFQPNVADSQPGDAKYSPLWRINMVEWQNGTTPKELKSEAEILAASQKGDVKVMPSELVVNCPFVQWEGGSLQVRADKALKDDSAYGGGQVLSIDTEKMTATFVAHRGFAPDGSTIYYIATDASVKEVADALGVTYVNKTGATLYSGASSDLWVFTNGIKGTGPMGFQASIASSDVDDAGYSPMWRIIATTWADAGHAEFLTSGKEVSSHVTSGDLSIKVAGVVANCPFVEVPA